VISSDSAQTAQLFPLRAHLDRNLAAPRYGSVALRLHGKRGRMNALAYME